MPWAAAESWRAHRAQRDLVRDLRAYLVEYCDQITEETPEYLTLNTAVSEELKRLPRWQRLQPVTDPALWRKAQARRPRPAQQLVAAPIEFLTASGTRVTVTHEHHDDPDETDFFQIVCEGCPYRHGIRHTNQLRPGYFARVLQGRDDIERSAAQHAKACTGTRSYTSVS